MTIKLEPLKQRVADMERKRAARKRRVARTSASGSPQFCPTRGKDFRAQIGLISHLRTHHHHHHHLSLIREGRWRTTDDFTTSFLHFYLFSTALRDLAKSRPVYSLVLPSHLFLCLPCLLPPFTVLCKMVLARHDERETCAYHFSLHLFTISLCCTADLKYTRRHTLVANHLHSLYSCCPGQQMRFLSRTSLQQKDTRSWHKTLKIHAEAHTCSKSHTKSVFWLFRAADRGSDRASLQQGGWRISCHDLRPPGERNLPVPPRNTHLLHPPACGLRRPGQAGQAVRPDTTGQSDRQLRCAGFTHISQRPALPHQYLSAHQRTCWLHMSW